LRRLRDVVLELLLETVHISLVLQLDPVRFLDLDVEGAAGLNKGLEDVVCGNVVTALPRTLLLWALVDHNPVLVAQLD
jgi:hypothetical protein